MREEEGRARGSDPANEDEEGNRTATSRIA